MNEDLRILIEMAKMYYEDNANQTEVAERFNVSRSLVSKYLTKARELGIVEISINTSSVNPYRELEDRVKNAFHLEDVICVEYSDNFDLMNHRMGIAAAKYLSRVIVEDSVIAVAPGRAIQSLTNSFSSRVLMPSVTVFPLTGGLGDKHSDIQANVVGELLSQKIGGKFVYLHAPVIVDSADARDVFMKQSFITNVLGYAEHADIAIVGIGGIPTYNEMKSAYLHKIDSPVTIEDQSIVGDICYNFIDIHGQTVDCDWNDRVLSLSIDKIKKIPIVIGISGGEEKFQGIFASIKNELINILITDTQTCMKLLENLDEDENL